MSEEQVLKKNWGQFSGVVGLVLLLFGMFGGLVSSFSSPVILFHVLAGFLILSVWWFFFRVKKPRDKSSHTAKRRARFGLNAILYAVVFFGLLAGVNWLGTQDRYKFRVDVTSTGRHSLSDQTLKLLSSLSRPVKMVAFIGEANYTDSHRLLDLYKYNSTKIDIQYIDPTAKPHLVDKYGMSEGDILYIEYGTPPDLVGVSRLQTVDEEEVTNAILKLSRGAAKKVYFVVGHEEPGLQNGQPFGLQLLTNAIKNDHYDLEELVLSEKGRVPEDAAAVIELAPKFPLLESEKKMLLKYGEDGGRLILVGDPDNPQGKNSVSDIAASYGINFGNDVVIDEVQRPFGGSALGTQPLIRSFDNHPITKAFTSQNVVILNTACTVSAADKEAPGVQELMHTGESAWSETDLPALFGSEPKAEFDASSGDRKGPLSMAVAIEKKKLEEPDKDGTSHSSGSLAEFDKATRVVAFGDADWLLNANLQIYSNKDLFLNALNWVTGEEGGIVIRPKDPKAAREPLDRDTYFAILTWSFLLPEVFLLFGLSIWWRRRLA